MTHILQAVILSLFSFSAMADVQESINHVFEKINAPIAGFLFWPVPGIQLPLIVFVMVCGGVFFTVRFGFLNIRLFKHAIQVVQGKYDDPNDEGEISHFQALTSALSATVGLGNIAGVAVAIQLGGPGAVFWLWLSAFFGMSMKFASCTFAQLYRDVRPDGTVIGGPMIYLRKGFAEVRNMPTVGKVLGVIYAILTVGASFGGGNMFQGNQTYELLASRFVSLQGFGPRVAIGVILAVSAGIVLLGGIKRIADVTSKLVPLMCGFYILTCLVIIISNISAVPGLIASVFAQAFAPDALYGGTIAAVMIQGIKRASFSNEAGVGSAAIAHAAAKTKEPVREGTVAMIGPFIDTHLVCTFTSLAVLITGAHLKPELAGKGAEITAEAFATLGTFMPYALTIAAIVFAYSTIISWSYYGEKAWQSLFGDNSVMYYRMIYILFVALGPILSLGAVLEFSDLMILGMAFPNIIGMVFLSKKLMPMVKDYVGRLQSGKMPTYK